jgi:nitrogen regulatory protein PII-like uncharacterized protein
MFLDPPWSAHLLTNSLAEVFRVKGMCLKSMVSMETNQQKKAGISELTKHDCVKWYFYNNNLFLGKLILLLNVMVTRYIKEFAFSSPYKSRRWEIEQDSSSIYNSIKSTANSKVTISSWIYKELLSQRSDDFHTHKVKLVFPSNWNPVSKRKRPEVRSFAGGRQMTELPWTNSYFLSP